MDTMKNLPEIRVKCQGRLKTRWFFSQIRKNLTNEFLQHSAKPAFTVSAQDLSIVMDWWTCFSFSFLGGLFFFSSICLFLFIIIYYSHCQFWTQARGSAALGSMHWWAWLLHPSALLQSSGWEVYRPSGNDAQREPCSILDYVSHTWDSRIPRPNSLTRASRFFTDILSTSCSWELPAPLWA